MDNRTPVNARGIVRVTHSGWMEHKDGRMLNPRAYRMITSKHETDPMEKTAAIDGPNGKTKPSDSNAKSSAIGRWLKVHKYKSHGETYYRFVWGCGHTVGGVRHIPGGNVKNAIATSRAVEVRRWITLGRSPDEICKLIDGWRNRNRRGSTR